MQNLENSRFKVAEENLMGHIRQGRDALVQTREDIASGNIKRSDKHEELFDRLYAINLEPQPNIQELKIELKNLIKELEYVIQNKIYDNSRYLREIILKIEWNRANLKYIICEYEEQVKYENILDQIKYQLTLKLLTNLDKGVQKQKTA